MDDLELKKAFAQALLKVGHNNPLAAAQAVFPGRADFARAAQAASTWPDDPAVKAELANCDGNQISAETELPTKVEYARTLWAYGTDEDFKPRDRKDFLQLFGDVMGYLPKSAALSNTTNNSTVLLMQVNDYGDNEAWEEKLKSQQAALINGEYEPKH